MPDNHQFHALSNLYKMFADATRVKIMWALSKERMCVCDLAVLLGILLPIGQPRTRNAYEWI